MNKQSKSMITLAGLLAFAFVAALPSAQADLTFERIDNYDAYIAGDKDVVVWYGRRIALVLDDETEPEKRDPKTMKVIVSALDDIFDAYDRVTGRRPKLTAPLNGKIRIEVSSKVGGGLAHHGRLGVAIGDGFFQGLYKRFAKGTRTVDQVIFYEVARNYWMGDMNPPIDYHTSKGPEDYGWWTVGFNNAMSIFLPSEIDSIDDMFYFGNDGNQFSNGMESNLDAYMNHPEKYNWENSWNVPLIPWKERTSVNDLMTGLMIRLHREQGGIDFIKRLYDEIPNRTSLETRSDRQGARDNFYEACSLASHKDLHSFFTKQLRWKISPARQQLVSKAVAENLALVARQWDVHDLELMVDNLPANPMDVDLSATFESETGISLTVPGFYDGGNRFIVRFTAPNAGTWKYVTASSTADLDKRTGDISVHPASKGRKGGIVIDSAAPMEFRYKNGDSYFPIAFESDWLFALDAENPDDIPNTRKLVDSLAENGFNQIVMNVFAYDVKWKKDDKLTPKHDYGSPRVFPFEGNNDEPDHSKLCIEYFQRLDRVIEYLDQKGIAAHLMIYVWNKRVNWPEADSKADNRYFDYVVRRYQAYPNMVWDVSKEALGYGHTDVTYIHKRIERLRRLDAYQRLITVHDYSYCRRFAKNIDFVSVQLWLSELYSVMRNVRENIPAKPILNIEHGGYERGPYVVFTGNYTSPEVCLERAYQCVFAGTYPTHYWQGAAWNVVITDIDSLAPNERPRLDYYRHMKTFVEKYDVGRLKAGDKSSNAGFSLHNGKNLYLYYVPKECEFIGVRPPKELRGKNMTGTWFNPFDGSFSDPVEQEITQWPAFTKPHGKGFRILVVEILP